MDNTSFVVSKTETPVTEDKNAGKVEHSLSDTKEPTPTERSEVNIAPYIVELTESTRAYNTFDVKKHADNINSYIVDEIKSNDLKDDKETYKSILDRITKESNSKGLDIYTYMDKLNQYVEIQNKLKEAIKEREDLLKADPMTLSAKKLKEYLSIKGKNV